MSPKKAVYYAFLMVCMLQLPVALLLAPHVMRHTIQWTRTTTRNTTDTEPRFNGTAYTLHMEEELGLASGLTGVWACIYLYLSVLDEIHEFSAHSDGDELCISDEGLSDVSRWLDAARLCFWACVSLQARILWAHTTWSEDALQWQAAQRVGALYALTRTFRGARRLYSFHLLGGALYLWSSWRVWPWLTLAILPFDALLMLGHLYDQNTPIQTALNARLVYLASASSISLAYLCSSASSLT